MLRILFLLFGKRNTDIIMEHHVRYFVSLFKLNFNLRAVIFSFFDIIKYLAFHLHLKRKTKIKNYNKNNSPVNLGSLFFFLFSVIICKKNCLNLY